MMPEFRPSIDAPPRDAAGHYLGSRERFLLNVFLIALLRSGEVEWCARLESNQ
jgi:hypothetical protein